MLKISKQVIQLQLELDVIISNMGTKGKTSQSIEPVLIMYIIES